MLYVTNYERTSGVVLNLFIFGESSGRYTAKNTNNEAFELACLRSTHYSGFCSI